MKSRAAVSQPTFIGTFVWLTILGVAMVVVSVSLPEELLQQADALIERRGFAGRSELLRACMRDFLAASAAEEKKGRRAATVTLVYPDGLERTFSKIRHHFVDVVQSMMHGHSGGSCVETFVVEGPGERVLAFVDALRGAREALQVGVVYTDVHEPDERARRGKAPTHGHGHSHGAGKEKARSGGSR